MHAPCCFSVAANIISHPLFLYGLEISIPTMVNAIFMGRELCADLSLHGYQAMLILCVGSEADFCRKNWRLIQQVVLHGIAHYGCRAGEIHFFHQAHLVCTDGLATDGELPGNLANAPALG